MANRVGPTIVHHAAMVCHGCAHLKWEEVFTKHGFIGIYSCTDASRIIGDRGDTPHWCPHRSAAVEPEPIAVAYRRGQEHMQRVAMATIANLANTQPAGLTSRERSIRADALDRAYADVLALPIALEATED